MANEAQLGDLIVEVKLDDAQYRAQVKETLQGTVTQSKTASRQVQQSLSAGFNTAQTMQGLRALQGSLYLVTGQTGFLAIEAGRTAVALSKMATASGGLTAALWAAGGSGLKFLKGLNPIVLALSAAAAAFGVYKYAASGSTRETDRASRASDELAESIRRETEERKRRQSVIAAETGRNPQGGNQSGAKDPGIARDPTRDPKGEVLDAELKKAREDNQRRQKEIFDMRRTIAVEYGGRMPSDFMTGQMRELQLFKERADAMRASAQGATGPSFGIGTLASSGFRFGGGKGSVLGEQSEEKKNGEKLDEINATLKTEFEKLLQRISGNPALSGFGVPYSGLPGL